MKVRIPNQNGGMNQQQMLKKVQQMQEDMANLQEDLDSREYEGKAGGDMVTVTVTGKHEVVSVKIKPEALEECEGDPEMLEDFVTIAVNEAIAKAVKTQEEEMGAITSGLNIPGMPGMF